MMHRQVTTTLLLLFVSAFLMLVISNAVDAKEYELIWNFDEGNGDVAKEADGTGNDGEFTGAGKGKIKWVDGKYGKALEFSGKVGGGQWVEVPHTDDMNIQDAITMEAWVFPTTIAGDKRTIITKAAYYLQIEPTSQVATYFYGLANEGYHLSNGQVKENEWSHVAVTYDGKEIKFYINGEQDTKVIKTKGQIISRPEWGVHLGGERDGCCPRYFQGTIDELKIANFAKDEAAIQESMNAGAPVEPADKLPLTWGRLKASR
jgi:hypothetical protein